MIERNLCHGEAEVRRICRRFDIDEIQSIQGLRDFSENVEIVPNDLKPLLTAISTLTCSTAECERGFSLMNNIITGLRASLLIDNVSCLMFINCNGSPVAQFTAKNMCILGITISLLFESNAFEDKSTSLLNNSLQTNSSQRSVWRKFIDEDASARSGILLDSDDKYGDVANLKRNEVFVQFKGNTEEGFHQQSFSDEPDEDETFDNDEDDDGDKNNDPVNLDDEGVENDLEAEESSNEVEEDQPVSSEDEALDMNVEDETAPEKNASFILSQNTGPTSSDTTGGLSTLVMASTLRDSNDDQPVEEIGLAGTRKEAITRFSKIHVSEKTLSKCSNKSRSQICVKGLKLGAIKAASISRKQPTNLYSHLNPIVVQQTGLILPTSEDTEPEKIINNNNQGKAKSMRPMSYSRLLREQWDWTPYIKGFDYESVGKASVGFLIDGSLSRKILPVIQHFVYNMILMFKRGSHISIATAGTSLKLVCEFQAFTATSEIKEQTNSIMLNPGRLIGEALEAYFPYFEAVKAKEQQRLVLFLLLKGNTWGDQDKLKEVKERYDWLGVKIFVIAFGSLVSQTEMEMATKRQRTYRLLTYRSILIGAGRTSGLNTDRFSPSPVLKSINDKLKRWIKQEDNQADNQTNSWHKEWWFNEWKWTNRLKNIKYESLSPVDIAFLVDSTNSKLVPFLQRFVYNVIRFFEVHKTYVTIMAYGQKQYEITPWRMFINSREIQRYCSAIPHIHSEGQNTTAAMRHLLPAFTRRKKSDVNPQILLLLLTRVIKNRRLLQETRDEYVKAGIKVWIVLVDLEKPKDLSGLESYYGSMRELIIILPFIRASLSKVVGRSQATKPSNPLAVSLGNVWNWRALSRKIKNGYLSRANIAIVVNGGATTNFETIRRLIYNIIRLYTLPGSYVTIVSFMTSVYRISNFVQLKSASDIKELVNKIPNLLQANVDAGEALMHVAAMFSNAPPGNENILYFLASSSSHSDITESALQLKNLGVKTIVCSLDSSTNPRELQTIAYTTNNVLTTDLVGVLAMFIEIQKQSAEIVGTVSRACGTHGHTTTKPLDLIKNWHWRTLNIPFKYTIVDTASVGFLIDSTVKHHFDLLQKLVYNVYKLFADGSMASMITFAGGTDDTLSKFRIYRSMAAWQSTCSSIFYHGDGGRRTGAALVAYQPIFKTTQNTKVLFLIISGPSNDDVAGPAKALAADGVSIFTLGIGDDAKTAEMKSISRFYLRTKWTNVLRTIVKVQNTLLKVVGTNDDVKKEVGLLSDVSPDINPDSCVFVPTSHPVKTLTSNWNWLPLVPDVKYQGLHGGNVVLLVDLSKRDMIGVVKRFLYNVVRLFDLEQSLFTVVGFGEYSKLIFETQRFSNDDAIKEAVNKLHYIESSDINTAHALQYFQNSLTRLQMKSPIRIIGFVVTRSKSDYEIFKVAEELKGKDGVTMAAVGIGDEYSREELSIMASNGQLVFAGLHTELASFLGGIRHSLAIILNGLPSKKIVTSVNSGSYCVRSNESSKSSVVNRTSITKAHVAGTPITVVASIKETIQPVVNMSESKEDPERRERVKNVRGKSQNITSGNTAENITWENPVGNVNDTWNVLEDDGSAIVKNVSMLLEDDGVHRIETLNKDYYESSPEVSGAVSSDLEDTDNVETTDGLSDGSSDDADLYGNSEEVRALDHKTPPSTFTKPIAVSVGKSDLTDGVTKNSRVIVVNGSNDGTKSLIMHTIGGNVSSSSPRIGENVSNDLHAIGGNVSNDLHVIGGNVSSSSPIIGGNVSNNLHVIGENVSSSSPMIGGNVSNNLHVIGENVSSSSPMIAVNVSNDLPSVNGNISTSSPVIGRHYPNTTPMIGENITTSSPVIGRNYPNTTPVNSENITTSSPVIGRNYPNTTPVIEENITTSSPVIGRNYPNITPVIGENITTSSPVIGRNYPNTTPVIEENITTSSPVIDRNYPNTTPVIGENITTSSPVIGRNYPNTTPVIDENITTSSPVIGRNYPNTTSVIGENITTSSPVIGRNYPNTTPVIGENITTSSPVIGRNYPNTTPVIEENITTSSPVIGRNYPNITPVIGENITTSLPVIGRNYPNTSLMIGENITTNSPVIGRNFTIIADTQSENITEDNIVAFEARTNSSDVLTQKPNSIGNATHVTPMEIKDMASVRDFVSVKFERDGDTNMDSSEKNELDNNLNIKLSKLRDEFAQEEFRPNATTQPLNGVDAKYTNHASKRTKPVTWEYTPMQAFYSLIMRKKRHIKATVVRIN